LDTNFSLGLSSKDQDFMVSFSIYFLINLQKMIYFCFIKI
jgi:hypothetical protein